MTWQERVRPTIKLASPNGNIFEPLWSGNSRTIEKKLGIFSFPKIKGIKIQDLDVGGVSYPLTLLFEGPDNDIKANSFFNACKETGEWIVDHPVLGPLELQLVSVTEQIQPVTSGNLTVIETAWLEPKASNVEIQPIQIGTLIQNNSSIANESAINQLENNTSQELAGFTKKIATDTDKIVTKIISAMKTITSSVASINARLNSINRSINTTITQATIDILSLGGQIQQLVQLPVLATNNISARLTAYSAMVSDIFTLLPSGDSEIDKNTVSLIEAALSATIVAIAQTVSTGTLQTRSQAIEAIEIISQLFANITDGLDEVQELFQAKTLDLQYFSQSDSFADAAQITSLGIKYLLISLFDLSVEKRFSLKTPRAPIEITIKEYGELGEADSNFDLFIESNELTGNDILLLPAKREVVVYV
jgi:prophage DNA circulation protein